MRNYVKTGVALLSLIILATGCTTPPAPSNNALFNLALVATETPKPTPNCPEEGVKVTPFPRVLLENIQSPIDHIQQGDSYGTDLELAYASHQSNVDKITAYEKACADGHDADLADHKRREAIRQSAKDAVDEATGDK